MKRLLSVFTLCALLLSPILALADNAQLDWTANTELDLAGYKVYESTTSGSYTAPPVATLGKVNTYNRLMPIVTIDTKFFYTVSAYDTAGLESGKSNEVSKTALALPGAPVLTVITKTVSSLTVSWPNVVAADGTNAAVDVRIFQAPGTWATAKANACTTGSPCVLTGLLASTTYTVQAAAYRIAGTFGALSAPVAATTLTPNVAPSNPTGLTVQ